MYVNKKAVLNKLLKQYKTYLRQRPMQSLDAEDAPNRGTITND